MTFLAQIASRDSGGLKKLGSIFYGESSGFGSEFRLGFLVKFGRGGGAVGDGNACQREKLFLARGRANAEQTRRLDAGVAKLVWCVGGYVDGLARGYNGF